MKADINVARYPSRNQVARVSTVPISLNPAQQVEVYSVIEPLICEVANTFLFHEYHGCRMSVDSLTKVMDYWKSKGRPPVLEFRYDQSTQRDLIVANQNTFRFYGPNANDPLQVNAMLYAWKNNARDMSIRTFCYPDSIIKIHLRDTFVILDYLGGHPAQYIALYELRAKMVRWMRETNPRHTMSSSASGEAKRGESSPKGSVRGSIYGNPAYPNPSGLSHASMHGYI
jgi:hypothetical protein